MAPPTEPAPEPETETQTIDRLLEAYLARLDEYTTLRAALNARQADLYHSLARANFSADRGIRYYGQDYYDERMQAGRRLAVQLGEDGVSAVFTVTTPVVTTEEPDPPTKEEEEKDAEEDAEKEDEEDDTTTTKKKKSTDPLRWFGILTPAALRQAQGHAVTAVEDIIPRLATVSGEMAALELAVRRARKKRKVREEREKKEKRERGVERRGVVEGVVG